MDKRVTPPKRVTSPIWGTPPPCKQALIEQSNVLAKRRSKCDCLVKVMLLIKNFTPSLNVQSDSLWAKVFT